MNVNLYYVLFFFYFILVGALFNYVRTKNFNIKTLGYLTYIIEILHKRRSFVRKISYNERSIIFLGKFLSMFTIGRCLANCKNYTLL